LSSVAIDNHLKEIARLLARQAARSWLVEHGLGAEATDSEPAVIDEAMFEGATSKSAA
jgi:hypothetical protein